MIAHQADMALAVAPYWGRTTAGRNAQVAGFGNALEAAETRAEETLASANRTELWVLGAAFLLGWVAAVTLKGLDRGGASPPPPPEGERKTKEAAY